MMFNKIFFLSIIVFYPFVLSAQEVGSHKAVAYWSFDSIVTGTANAGKMNSNGNVYFNLSSIPDGIKGNCIKLNGRDSRIEVSLLKRPETGKLTITAWIALQSYPWNNSPILNQGSRSFAAKMKEYKEDIFFGVDAYGRLIFGLKIGDSLQSCASSQKLDLLLWNHVSATFNIDQGISVYINGRLAGRKKTIGSIGEFSGTDLWLGMNLHELGPAGSERKSSESILSPMVLDGLMDEVKVFDKCLTQLEITADYSLTDPGSSPPLQYHKLPDVSNLKKDKFGAFYTRLNYDSEWEKPWRMDSFPDIVVHFDQSPVKYIFWRGSSYGGIWVSENQKWVGDQSLERVGKGKSPLGCAEHMSDKQCRYSNVRILEKSNARVVVHWRYAISDILYNIFGAEGITEWGDWADEYYYIYPDGISTRVQTLYTDKLSHEWQETIVIHQPGTVPEDNIETLAMTLANMKGESRAYSWEKGPPEAFAVPEDITIQMVNLKSTFRPFIIFEPGAGIKPFTGAVRPEYSIFPWWNHWPIAQIPNDGRLAFAPDRPSHSSLSQSIEGSNVIHKEGEDRYKVATLTGMTNSPIDSLALVARSWNTPPHLQNLSANILFLRISKEERAYILNYLDDSVNTITFQLAGSEEYPIFNPVFVLQDVDRENPQVEINGKAATEGRDFRTGISENGQETSTVIWFDLKSNRETSFSIKL